MVVRSRGRARFAVAAALALMLSAAGCASDEPTTNQSQEEPTESATVSEQPSEPPSTSEAPSESPPESPSLETSSSPSNPPSSSDAGPRDGGPLLAANEVPGFNQDFTWKVARTRNQEGRNPFGTCQKFAMTSIGATDVRVRHYQPAVPDAASTAANLVANFADEKTAKRAYEVLKSWRSQCKEELSQHDRQEVGKLRSVALPGAPKGVGNWYLLTYGPPKGDPDAGYFDAQGMTRVGTRISFLQMRTVGQDYNYVPGQEPMVDAVKASAARLAAG